ncbi:MAG TPA: phospholipase D-like domain-containing protein [Longimicrobium sp.]|nr:phospholipase D-like domain-containing protein [Longimicrobium sp.]
MAAVAFARASGNDPALLDSLFRFASTPGHSVALTFGADLFGGTAPASDLSALEVLLGGLAGLPRSHVYLYHEPNRTFHPKVYVFSNEAARRALVIIGSSNWSRGGLVDNVEANVALHLDLSDEDHRALFEEIRMNFEKYWSEE